MRTWIRAIYLSWDKGKLSSLYADELGLIGIQEKCKGYTLIYYKTNISIQDIINLQEKAKNKLWII